MRSKAFTLIELLIVSAIILVLAAAAIISYTDARNKSNYGKILGDMEAIAKAGKMYEASNNSYPGDVGVRTMPTGMDAYLAQGWPNPPCDSNIWVYDWENRQGLNPAPDYVGVTLRHDTNPSDPANPVWTPKHYYPVRSTVPAGTYGTNILTEVTDKSVSCN